MKARHTLMCLLFPLLLIAVQFGQPASVVAATAEGEIPEWPYYFDFSQTLDPWVARDDHSADDQALHLQYDSGWQVPPGGPNRFAQLTCVTGGPLWMSARLPMSAESVTVAFDSMGVQNCEGCIPIAYVGRTPPTGPWQFSTDFSELSAGWQSHSFTLKVPPDRTVPPGRVSYVYVAVGFTLLDLEKVESRPDAIRSVAFDNIHISGVTDQE